MRKLKEKVEELVRTNEAQLSTIETQLATIKRLEEVQKTLKAQANKVGPLISENVNLTNKLEDLQNEVEQLTDSL